MVGFSIQFNGKTNHKLLVYGYGKFEWAYTPNGNMEGGDRILYNFLQFEDPRLLWLVGTRELAHVQTY